MDSDNMTNDDALDTQDTTGSGADSATQVIDDASVDSGNGDNNAAIQDRMASDASPWYSPSEGKVVTVNGDVIIDPKTKQPFTSMEAFERWQSKQSAPTSATQKTTQGNQQQQPPLSTSFDSYITGGKPLTPEELQELSKPNSDYKYNDDLIPALDPNAAAQQEQAPIDPVERVRAERKNIEAVAVQPIREIRDALIKQGGDPALVDQLLAPVMQKQNELVDSHFNSAYEKALEERLDGKYGSRLSRIDEEKLQNASETNIEALARKYYPKGGKDALFALINGHYEAPGADGKKPFVRGPSSQVIDLITSVAMDGKKFKTEQERNAAYANTFRRLTADPVKARVLIDIAHNYWLGKKSSEAFKLAFNKGKESATIQQQRIKKTIKTQPASYQPPATGDDDGTRKSPFLSTVMDGIRRRM